MSGTDTTGTDPTGADPTGTDPSSAPMGRDLSDAARAELLRLSGVALPLRVSVPSLRKLERQGLITHTGNGWKMLPPAHALVPAAVFTGIGVGASVVVEYEDASGTVEGVVTGADLDGHRIAVLRDGDDRPRELTSWEGYKVLHVDAGGRLRAHRAPDGTFTLHDRATDRDLAVGLTATDISSLWIQTRDAAG